MHLSPCSLQRQISWFRATNIKGAWGASSAWQGKRINEIPLCHAAFVITYMLLHWWAVLNKSLLIRPPSFSISFWCSSGCSLLAPSVSTLTLNHSFLLNVVLGLLSLPPSLVSFVWFPLGSVDYIEQKSKAIIHIPLGRLIYMKWSLDGTFWVHFTFYMTCW